MKDVLSLTFLRNQSEHYRECFGSKLTLAFSCFSDSVLWETKQRRNWEAINIPGPFSFGSLVFLLRYQNLRSPEKVSATSRFCVQSLLRFCFSGMQIWELLRTSITIFTLSVQVFLFFANLRKKSGNEMRHMWGARTLQFRSFSFSLTWERNLTIKWETYGKQARFITVVSQISFSENGFWELYEKPLL